MRSTRPGSTTPPTLVPIASGPPQKPKNPQWSQDTAREGDEVELTADAPGTPDGTAARFRILEQDQDGLHDRVAEVTGKVERGKARAKWKYEYVEDADDARGAEDQGKPYTLPEFIFHCEVRGLVSDASPILKFGTTLRFQVRYPDGEVVDDEFWYVLRHGKSGKVFEGQLDKQGWLELKDAAPGKYVLEIPRRVPKVEIGK